MANPNDPKAPNDQDNGSAESTKVIGEGTTQQPPGGWQIGNDEPLTPERAAEGDRKKSDAV